MALWIGSTLAKGGIFDISETEAAFHPWWDQLQDYVTYTNIIIGLFAIPTSNSKLECALFYPNSTKSPVSTSNNVICLNCAPKSTADSAETET
jgi:hypothetical protein